ncbi:DUF397 domain-containing protein [Catenuloplanes japonicus]|nr:DUF397 domain-containing protein [Catenuloplanes japonicus]
MTSSHSDTVTCVEVRANGVTVDIRDSKRRLGGVLHVSPDAWTAFVRRFG